MRFLGLGLVALFSVQGGPSAAQDASGREHILQMAGCHDVTYYFHEDGERDYFNDEKPPAIVTQDLVTVTEDEPERVVLQHASIGEGGRAIPHWHEVWTWAREDGRSPSMAERQGVRSASCVTDAPPRGR